MAELAEVKAQLIPSEITFQIGIGVIFIVHFLVS